MNVKKASEEWNCSGRTVSRYCKEGYIDGCELINGSYTIPDDSRRPMISKASVETKIYDNILKAANMRMAINAKAFHLKGYELTNYLDILCRGGLLVRCTTPITNIVYYLLGIEGITYFTEKSEKRRHEILAVVLQVVASGTQVAATIS